MSLIPSLLTPRQRFAKLLAQNSPLLLGEAKAIARQIGYDPNVAARICDPHNPLVPFGAPGADRDTYPERLRCALRS